MITEKSNGTGKRTSTLCVGKCNGDRTTDGVCTGVGGGDGCYTTTEERIELLGCSDWRRLQILDNCEERRQLLGNTE